jgi:c(7)-type cytochrome triheme protein
MSSGLDPFATVTERAQVLRLLDAMSTRAAPSLRARIAELRAAVMPLLDGSGDGLRVRREQKVRLLDRIALERSLRPDGGPAPVDAIANGERTNATRELRLIQARLAALDRDGVSIADVDGAKSKTALKGLFTACGPCHRPNQDETALRPVLAGRPTLTSAMFTHKPHLLQAKCESCHASVAKSNAGPDVNLPAVASCQSCHNDSQARADCGSCHRYHPRSAAEMVVAWR